MDNQKHPDQCDFCEGAILPDEASTCHNPACEEYYCTAQVVIPVSHTTITPHLLFSGDPWEIVYDRCSTLHECVCGAQWEVVLFDKQERE